MAEIQKEQEEIKGALLQSLDRNSKEIRKDRAADIAEGTETAYRRKVEDLHSTLRSLLRQQRGMLDLSPNSRDSLILANDFDAFEFSDKDLELALQIRQTLLKRNLAGRRYEHLFGKAIQFDKIEDLDMYIEILSED